MRTSLSAVAAFTALTAPASFAQNALKAGDPVDIELKVPAEDAASVSTRYTISENGTIKMPYIEGEIKAAGLSVSQLARRLEAAYKEKGIYTAPTFNVILRIEGAAHKVTVGGEVKAGGAHVPLREGMKLFDAIAAAGGFTEFAKVRKVKLIRAGKAAYYDMRDIKADDSNNPVLRDGDTIVVPGD
jgi:polysaccharide export outer membrane protein